jgi:hypothetical protein
MKPLLTDVTLCAVDCANPQLAARALERSMQQCVFGAALLFSDQPVAGVFSHRIIPRIASREAYSGFLIRDLPQHIETSHVLVVQWDGYVVDASAWTEDFLAYDYIGAKWHWYQDHMRIGNGGFSLRSRRLMAALTELAAVYDGSENEDTWIGRTMRPRLEADFGIRFAPEDIADQFSYERALPYRPTFGFHGLFNMARHLNDDALVGLLEASDGRLIDTTEFLDLMVAVVEANNMALFERLRAQCQRSKDREAVLSKVRQRPVLSAAWQATLG